jgi:hypothetical protein
METKKDLYTEDLYNILNKYYRPPKPKTIEAFMEEDWSIMYPSEIEFILSTDNEISRQLRNTRIHGLHPNDIIIVGDWYMEYFNKTGVVGYPCYAMLENGVYQTRSWLGITTNFKHGLVTMVHNQKEEKFIPHTYGTKTLGYGGDISEIEAFYWPSLFSLPTARIEVPGMPPYGSWVEYRVEIYDTITNALRLKLAAKEGYAHGQLTAYYEDGTIAETIDYKYGVIKGLHKRYDRHKNQIYSKRYE